MFLKKIALFIVLFFCGLLIVNAQNDKNIKSKELNSGFIFGFSYGYNIPIGDLSKRYGNNFKIDLTPTYYFKNSNFSIGVEASYIFSGGVKENSFLNLLSDDNYVIGLERSLSNIKLSERGVIIGGLISKIIPLNKNIRSGIRLELGSYFFRHWINFKIEGEVPQLKSEYLKGYDRLTGGLALKEFIGYQYLKENSKVNFYAGFEFYQGFTKNLRGYNYSEATFDKTKRNDNLIGIKFGWILPLYIVDKPEEIYY